MPRTKLMAKELNMRAVIDSRMPLVGFETQEELGKRMGLSRHQFGTRYRSNDWNLSEFSLLVRLLDVPDEDILKIVRKKK